MNDVLAFVAGIGFTVLSVIGIPVTIAAGRRAAVRRQLARHRAPNGRPAPAQDFQLEKFLEAPSDHPAPIPRPLWKCGQLTPHDAHPWTRLADAASLWCPGSDEDDPHTPQPDPLEAPQDPQKLDNGLTDAGLPHRRAQWPCSRWEDRVQHTAHTWNDPIVGTVRCPGIGPS